jgi:hypothetical protein
MTHVEALRLIQHHAFLSLLPFFLVFIYCWLQFKAGAVRQSSNETSTNMPLPNDIAAPNGDADASDVIEADPVTRIDPVLVGEKNDGDERCATACMSPLPADDDEPHNRSANNLVPRVPFDFDALWTSRAARDVALAPSTDGVPYGDDEPLSDALYRMRGH